MRIALAIACALLSAGATCDVQKPPVDAGPPTCAAEESCAAGSCVADPAFAGEEARRVCALACGADVRCTVGTACVATDDGPACLPVLGTIQTGAPCTADRECASGACSADEDGDTFCVELCDDDGGCADGLTCYYDGLRRVCLAPVPNPGPLGAACTYPQQCEAPLCIDLPGDDVPLVCADPCADADPCAEGQVCAPTAFGGQVCLNPLQDGAPCTADVMCRGGRCIRDDKAGGATICASPCPVDGCAAGFLCVLDDDDAPICMPLLDDRGPGEACAEARECASGSCAHFDPDGPDGPEDLGTLCAYPCVDGGCPAPDVCWEDDAAGVCGPSP